MLERLSIVKHCGVIRAEPKPWDGDAASRSSRDFSPQIHMSGGMGRLRHAHSTETGQHDAPASYVVRSHLAAAALRAISERLAGVSFAALAAPPLRPPLRPRATAAGSLSGTTAPISACASVTSSPGVDRGAASEQPLRER